MALIKLNTRSIPDDAVTPAKVSQNLGRRNMIINGDFQVWTLGTTVDASSEILSDRWLGYSTNSGVNNPGMRAVKGTGVTPIAEYGHYSEVKFISANTGINYLTFGQRIESSVTKNQLTAGDKVTFSCYIKRKQAAASDIKVHVRYPLNGVDSYHSGRTLLSAYDTSIAIPYTNTFNNLPLDTWVRISGTFDANSAMANRGCAVFLENGPSDLGVNNGDTIYETTGWQLEKGDTATSYEHRTYAEEKHACARYLVHVGSGHFAGYQNGTSAGICTIPLVTPLRVNPTITASGTRHIWRHNGFNTISSSTVSASSSNFNDNGKHRNSIEINTDGGGSGVNGYVACVYYSTLTLDSEI
jgi:hypothetical protein